MAPAFATEAFEATREGAGRFQPLPRPTGSPPYRLALDAVLPTEALQQIQSSGRMVVHVVGDTGGVKRPEFQLRVAERMEADFDDPDPTRRPAFFYHLGDVVYFLGEAEDYYPQFYDPYRFYPAPVFAIPGNHDGDVFARAPRPSLAAFVDNFCAREAHVTLDAQEITTREAMTQPNVFWTLETPLATFVGLCTNVPEFGVLEPAQQEWLTGELRDAPANKALLLAMHHPVYSADDHHSGSPRMKRAYEDATARANRVPDLVLTGHVHNYQRFTRTDGDREVPFIVAGAGGYHHLHTVGGRGARLRTPFRADDADATLESYCDDRHGYLRLTITRKVVTGEYIAVPEDDVGEWERADSFSLDLQSRRLVHGRIRE
jgi:hypothetical protein